MLLRPENPHAIMGNLLSGAAAIEEIKQFNNNSKIFLYTYVIAGEKDFDSIEETDARQSFIKLIIQQLRSHNFDGIGLHNDVFYNITNKNKPTIMEELIRVYLNFVSG